MDTLLNDALTVCLYGNLIVFPLLLLVFGLTEPWRKSWFGWAVMLLTIGVAQLSIRAFITTKLGEDYPGRDVVLLIGRAELFASGLALLIGLGVMKQKNPRR